TVCVVGKIRDLILQLSKSSIYSTKPFTHNHCLTYIAKNKRDATFKPDYLDGLVMHVEKGKVYLDGEFVNH
ncbi:hypothetical protein OU536_07155, partial [Escherichia coli]|nr:hypothetical protein [Escherichia coli]